MNPAEIFAEILKIQNPPLGVYIPRPGDHNYEICSWLHTTVNNFLGTNASAFDLKEPHFDFIQSDGINACATQPPNNFIGITKGLVDFSTFMFRNFLRDNDFLKEELEMTGDKALVIKHVQFSSWHKFRNENGILENLLEYSPTISNRRKIAEALFDYYVFFVVMHEIGHLNQKGRGFTFEFQNTADYFDNLERQVLEMDADKFAVNMLVEHLIVTYTNRNLPSNQPYLIFFSDKRTIVRCMIFILLFMFFMFSSTNNFQKYILEYSHPHPSLRAHYCIAILLKAFVDNSFLTFDESQTFGKQSVFDFGNVMERIFPNAGLRDYFKLIQNLELQTHHETLQNAARRMKNLNGYGKP